MSAGASLATADNIEDICELTPMQRGMMFHSLYDPRSSAYLEQVVCVFRGKLDENRLRCAFSMVVERYSALRVSCHWRGLAKPLQVVMKQVDVPWQTADWRSLSVADQRGRSNAWIEADRTLGFGLDEAPLMRCSLIRLADQSYRWIWTFHHILIDGWSLAIVLRDFFRFYESLDGGQRPALPPVRPYRDYVLWCQSHKDPEAERFWREYLAGVSPPAPVTSGKSAASGNNRESSLQLAETAGAELRDFARTNRLTPHVIISAALAVVLARWCGQADVIFGSTVSGRPVDLEHAEEMVGLFINAIPTRVFVDSRSDVVSWLHRLQDRQLECSRHSGESLADVQSWSAIPPGTNMFELLLVFENYPAPRDWRGVNLRLVTALALERTNYPLTLTVIPGKAFTFRLAWDENRFDSARANRFLDHLRDVLATIVSKSACRVGELPRVPECDKARLLGEWCGEIEKKASGYFRFQDCVSEYARSDPSRIAAVYDGVSLTYRDVERRSNGLAWRLAAAGVGPDVCVGIALARTPALLIAVLGVVKAGGAYVPINSSQPRERVNGMLKDAGVRLVLADAGELAWLVEEGVRVEPVSAEETDETFPSEALPGHLAYVIYTSGSTGRPKGCELPREAFGNLVEWDRNGLSGEGPWRALIVSSFGFDLTQKNLFVPLALGGSVHFPSTPYFDARAICEQIAGEQITTLNCTPSTFYALLDAAEAGDYRTLRSLKYVRTGGEGIVRARVQGWLRSPNCHARMRNDYGPTECADVCASAWVERGEDETSSVPFGHPIPNMRMYVLDESMNLVPVGVQGELYVGGIGLARGYSGRPGLTAERFVPDPFSGSTGGRLYRSGDFGRYLPDGSMEFLGRRDAQVKLRGHRIELGEIEAVMLRHSSLREVVVQVEEDASAHPRLIAYVAAVGGDAPGKEELRRHAAQWLPEIMVPSVWVALESIPLTVHGKVDRSELRRAGQRAEALAVFSTEPATPLERDLAAIWSAVLDVPHVDAGDNFFEMGGHSLNAISVISRIYQRFGVDLPLRRLFEAPTIRQLAAILTPELNADKGSGNAGLVALPRRRKSIGRPQETSDITRTGGPSQR